MAGRKSIETGLEPTAAVSKEMTASLDERQLAILGMLHEGDDTIIMIGPKEPGFWAVFAQSHEYLDGAPDPLDRWSKRMIQDLALTWHGDAIFPSDGPPYPPFQAWARATKSAWDSPVGMLVHKDAGLWISYRGAIRIPRKLDLETPSASPCVDCAAPCMTACPVGALGAQTYDTDACKAHLSTSDTASCMTQGCAARRACPVGQSYGRLPEQSAFHMKAFNPQ